MPKLLYRIFALRLENDFLQVKLSTRNNRLGRDLGSTIWALPDLTCCFQVFACKDVVHLNHLLP